MPQGCSQIDYTIAQTIFTENQDAENAIGCVQINYRPTIAQKIFTENQNVGNTIGYVQIHWIVYNCNNQDVGNDKTTGYKIQDQQVAIVHD